MPLPVTEPIAPSDEAAWAAVEARDRRFDGAFVYAVRTTGVYCRPSCASRRPHRANVAFYATPIAAEAAGFRACRRCDPRDMRATAGEAAVARARTYLEANADRAVSLAELAAAVKMSPFHLQRTFKQLVGVSPKAYGDARRVERFKERLKQGDTVSRATFEAGFNSHSSAYARSANGLGMTPAEYRRGGRGTAIRYLTTETDVGRVLIAGTARGVCAVILGDSDRMLEAALRKEFPEADISLVPGDDATIGPWRDSLVRYFRGAAARLDVPLDVRGTSFQERVWQELRAIPYGETRSYTDVAQAIGAPRAVRAVARACAANPVAIVIPCHRVVRSDGSGSGYRWGADRKRRILAKEHAIVARALKTA